MKNSETFLSYYNRISEFLREKTKSKKGDNFSQLLNRAKKGSLRNVINFYEKDIRELADLRNCIIHEYKNGKVIAEPNEFALDLIIKIYNKITEPQKILTIAKKKVVKVKESDSLSKILKAMHKNNYSQIPVSNEKEIIGLLTENGIMHWLGEKAKDDIFSLEETKAKEVLKHEENPKNYLLFSRNKTIYDAIEVFSRNLKNPRRKIQAILITQNGKSSEKLLGIVTVWDVASITTEKKV